VSKPRTGSRTATHRPATKRRRYRHDDPTAVDLFSGFGGLTRGIEIAGFTAITAANHNAYKVEVHEANHPNTEHWIADLVDPESADYHSARDLPAADLLVAGVSCCNHSQANTQKAYEQRVSLFDLDDPDFDARVTRSERDRATANCVLHYAAQHHPRLILVECTTELASWGPAIPGRPKVGDGSTYRWWLKQFDLLNYRCQVLYLNSMFFDVPQSRDRGYWVFSDRSLPEPDLAHRPVSRCHHCDRDVEAAWSWKTGIPATGAVRYGKQYEYRCPSCHRPVVPPMMPSLAALDLTTLGNRIGDRTKPLAAATMARAERCRQRFAEFPAVHMPAKAAYGSARPWQQLSTGTGIAAHRHDGYRQHLTLPMDAVTTALDRAVLLAIDNFQGGPRGVHEPLPTQVGSETLGLLSAGVLPYRKDTRPTLLGEAMPTATSDQIPGLLTAAGTVQFREGTDRRTAGLDQPLHTVVADGAAHGLLFSGWYKQNGSTGTETAPHPMTDPLGTLTAHDTTALLMADWRAQLADLRLEDCYFRMMGAHEIGRGCGFDVNFPDYDGTFVVWGSARDQVDGFGNAVSPQVGAWIGARLRAVLHT